MDKKSKLGIARFEKDVPFKEYFEKRKHPRFLLNLPIEYRHIGDSPISYSSHSINASEGGLLICLHERLKPGQYINLKIFYHSGSNMLTIETIAQVMWVDELLENEGEWPHGVKFVSITQQDLQEFKSFLNSLAPINGPNKVEPTLRETTIRHAEPVNQGANPQRVTGESPESNRDQTGLFL